MLNLCLHIIHILPLVNGVNFQEKMLKTSYIINSLICIEIDIKKKKIKIKLW